MSKYPNAPLVEVIFELKWGNTVNPEKGSIGFDFSSEESGLMPGRFEKEAKASGFNHLEVKNNIPPFPHIPKYKFSKEKGSFPLLQLGSGLFAVNQTDRKGYDYDWDTFYEDIKSGLKILEKSYPHNFEEMPVSKIELRYIDYFILEDKQCLHDFVSDNLLIKPIMLPDSFFVDGVVNNQCPQNRLILRVSSQKPQGQVTIMLADAVENEKNIIIMETTVRSPGNTLNGININSLADWSSQAHDLHTHTFNSIITDKLEETFK